MRRKWVLVGRWDYELNGVDLGKGKDVTVLMAIELNFLQLVTTEERVGPWLTIEFRNNGFRVFLCITFGRVCKLERVLCFFFVFSFSFFYCNGLPQNSPPSYVVQPPINRKNNLWFSFQLLGSQTTKKLLWSFIFLPLHFYSPFLIFFYI